MKPRILANLAFFAILAGFLGVWAVGDVLQIDVRHPPYEITADFEDSPGLQPGYDVGYLGTPIGRIDDVELRNGHVEVTLAIEEGREVPEGSSLAVRRKSAVGEPYVDVIPPEGAEPGGASMEEGDHVPIERTITPLSYSELFEALNDLVASVPEDDFGTLIHEFAIAVDGRSGSLRDMITGGDDALDTFAENADLMEDSTASLSRLVRVFAQHRGSFDQALQNTEAVTGTLANARADIETVLVDGNSLATRTADLLDDVGSDLSCAFHGLSVLTAGLDRPDVLAALEEMLTTAPAARDAFIGPNPVIGWESDGPYVRAIPPLNVGGDDPVPVFDSPRSLPEIAAPADCVELQPATAPGAADTGDAGGTGEVDGTPSPASDPGGDVTVDDEEASSDQEIDDSKLNPLWILLALLAIALIAAIRPWRFLPSRD